MVEFDGIADGTNAVYDLALDNICFIIKRVKELAREDYRAYMEEDMNWNEMPGHIQSNIQKWKYGGICESYLKRLLYCKEPNVDFYKKHVNEAKRRSSKLGWIESMIYMKKFKKSWKSTFLDITRKLWEECFEEYEDYISIYEGAFRILVYQDNFVENQCSDCSRRANLVFRCFRCTGFEDCINCSNHVNHISTCSKCSKPSWIY